MHKFVTGLQWVNGTMTPEGHALPCWKDKRTSLTLQWRNNERNGVSNRWRLHYLLKCWFRRRSKETSKFRVTDLCEGNPPVTGGFTSQGASGAENVSITIWWRHHARGKWNIFHVHATIPHEVKEVFPWKRYTTMYLKVEKCRNTTQINSLKLNISN